MKNRNIIRFFSKPNIALTFHSITSEKANEFFYFSDFCSLGKPGQLQCRQNSFSEINTHTENFKLATTLIPAKKAGTLSYKIPVIKMRNDEAIMGTSINTQLKETGACLSEIELSICNVDAWMLRLAVHNLRCLFMNFKMADASQLAGKMEELAADNKFQDVNNLLLRIKKIIAHLVPYV